MRARLEAQKVSPAADRPMLGLEMFVCKQSILSFCPIASRSCLLKSELSNPSLRSSAVISGTGSGTDVSSL